MRSFYGSLGDRLMEDTPQPAGQGDYVVVPGDSMVSIAARAGLHPDTIWNDAANSALKEARKDGELLLPGDRVTVMAIREKKEARATGKRYVFRRKGLTVKVTLFVQDEDGAAFAGKKYELIAGGKTLTGTTDDTGKIVAQIDPLSHEGQLSVWLEEPGLPNPWIRQVTLAELYPVEHLLGVQQRLSNLGLYTGELDGEAGPGTIAAVSAFQKLQSLEVTGEIDDALRSKLVEVHKV
jgi:hypothetical protein